MSAQNIIFLNLFFYLLGFLILFGFKSYILSQFAGWLSLVINVLGVLFSLSLIMNVTSERGIEIPWINLGDTVVSFDILLNDQTTFMYFLVQIIAFFVQLFSTKYLAKDPAISRYYAYLNLFILSMLGVIIAGNLMQLYFFWELVGFCSYLLIGFWYEKSAPANASLKAFLINRIGDAGLLIGIFLVFYLFKTFNFMELRDRFAGVSTGVFHLNTFGSWSAGQLLNAAGILMFCGAVAKSAQFPLQVWLPDAMEGPTPASALIHAATMVAAGVFLLARVSPILSHDAGFVIAIVGSFTSILAAYSAIFQYDIKKVLAYSTISQLGFMIAGIGVGAVGASLFHLTTHAFFKAGLFLSAGAVIHHLHHQQDMRKMGNLQDEMEVVFYGYAICAASLAGIPLFSGFLSKDALLISAYAYAEAHHFSYYLIIPVLLLISSVMTAYYIMRQFVMVFLNRQGNPIEETYHDILSGLEGVKKSFHDLLTADDDAQGDEKIINFLQKLGVFEISVLAMSLASLWFVFSASPFTFSDVWFIKIFVQTESHAAWIPYTVLGVSLASMIASFFITQNEIRNFYVNSDTEKSDSWLRKIGLNHFYLDYFYFNYIRPVFTGKLNTTEPEPAASFKKGLPGVVHYADSTYIDGVTKILARGLMFISGISEKAERLLIDNFVNGVSEYARKSGHYGRKMQGGQIQFYLVLMIALVICILILKTFLF